MPIIPAGVTKNILRITATFQLIIIDKTAIDKNYLDNQLNEIDNGDAEFLSLDQLDLMLDERIKKHED